MSPKNKIIEVKDHLVSGEHFRIVYDEALGYATTETPKTLNLSDYYPKKDYASHQEKHQGLKGRLYVFAQNLMLRYKLNILRNHGSGINVLDVGGGIGVFAEYVSKKELISVMGNSLTRPTMRRPIYTFEGRHKDFIRVFGKDNYPNNYNTQQRYFLDPSVFTPGDGSEFDTPPGHGRSPRFRGFDHNGILDHANVAPELLIISYIRKPATPRWGYVENNLGNTSYPIYNQGTSIDFELHISESSNLVNKILELSGVKLKQADISQVGRTKAQEKEQIRNR